MKNKVLLIIFALVAFISFGYLVEAKDFDVKPGEETFIPYPADSLAKKLGKKTDFTCKSLSDSTILTDHSGDGWGYGISYNTSSKIYNGKGSVECTYTTINNTTKTVTYGVRFAYSGVITIRGMQTEGLDANGDLSAIFPAFFQNGVKSYKVTSGASYIKVVCPKTIEEGHCTVQVTDDAYDKGNVTAKVEFTLADGTTFPVEIRINAWGSARAYPGVYHDCSSGTCKAVCTANSNQWEAKFGVYAGNINFWQAKTGSSINLPDCGDGSKRMIYAGTPIVFAGWVDVYDGVDSHNLQLTIKTKGKCKEEAGDGHFFASNASVRGDHKARYTACYEFVPMVRIAPGHGKLLGSHGWTEGVTGIFFKEPSGNSDITLPNENEVENEIYNKETKITVHHKLVGWKNETTNDVVKPGASVKPDGTVYSAIYDYDSSGSFYNKSVYLNDTVPVSVTGKKVISCTTPANEYVKVSMGTDESGNPACVVEGLKITPGEVAQPVTVEFEGGTKVIYNFTVTSDFGFHDQIFEPQIVVEYQEPKAQSDRAIITKLNCEAWDTKTWVQYDASASGEHIQGSSHISSAYAAKCKTGGDWSVGVCLDPGIAGPNGATYVFDKVITHPGIVRMVRLLKENTDKVGTHSPNGGEGQHGNTYRMGVNTAFRIAVTGIGDRSSYVPQDWINAGERLVNQRDVDGAVRAIYDRDPHSAAAEVTRTYLERFLDESEDVDPKQVFEVKKVTKTILSEDKTSYTIDYTGSLLYVPSHVEFGQTVYNHAGGNGTFYVNLKLQDTGNTDEKHRKIYSMDGTQLVVPNIKNLKIPRAVKDASGNITSPLTDEQKDAAIKLAITGDGALNIYIIKPGNGEERQRLLFFDEDNNDVFLYLDPGDGDHYCNQVPALNVKECEAKANGAGGGECNIELFAQQCCNLVNEGDYPNLFHNYCTNSCSNNTVAQVCEYVPFETQKNQGQTATMYHINEGVKYHNNKFEEDLGSCVVNIGEFTPGHESSFEYVDDVGNSRALRQYNGNKYCRVTCKEDWDITMGTFGSYMGAEAVSAGTYFQISEADIFIKGDQSCYTSKMNVGTYHGDQKALADKLPGLYNQYSKAAHELRDMLYNGQTSAANGNSVNHKNNETYDKDKGSTGEACKGYKEVQLYHMVTGSCSTPGCTPPQTRVDDEKVRLCSTHDEYEGTADGATNNKVEFSYIGWIKDSMKFKDADNLIGKYKKYTSTGGGTGVSVVPEAYDSLKAEITCKGKDRNVTGDNSADTIICTIASVDGGSVSEEFDWSDIKATDSNLETEVNERIVKVNNQDATSDGGHDSEVLRAFINQNKKYLQGLMEGARSAIAEKEAQLKGNANMWFDCQNFIMYTSSYNGKNIKKETHQDDEELAKAAYGIDTSFTALGSTRAPVSVSVEFDPTVSYTYDELVYMNLIENPSASIYGQNGIHDNILVPYDKKNGTLELGKADNAKPIKYLNGSDSDRVFVNYSVKSGENYSNITNSKTYTGDTHARGAQATKPIVLCKVGEKSDNGGQGQRHPYAPFAGSDANGWKDGNCYIVKLYEYEGVAYTKETISNSSFYKNKGSWNEYVNGVLAHGGDEENEKNPLIDSIKKYEAVTGTKFATDNDSLLRWSKVGSINVFPVSMTTARNLYTYTYSFNNIGVYFAKEVTDDTRFSRLMGTVDSVFRYNSRTCFYEVKEDICKCCGDPAEYHTTTTRKTDVDVVNRFIEKHHDDLYAATSDPVKISKNTSGSMGFYTTVESLNSFLSNVSDGGGDNTVSANWSDSGIFTYDGYSRYVTNKGDIAAKAIEYMGEEIYSANNTAEYAYRLTPAAIADIKSDNAKSSYGTNYNELQVYGAVQIAPVSNGNLESAATWNMNVNNKNPETEENVYQNISFQHYGSKFLEDVASKYVKKTDDNGFTNYDLASRTENDASIVCAMEEPASNDGKTNSSTINNKIKDGCRWVDYIENKNSNPNGGSYNGPFRLAFK